MKRVAATPRLSLCTSIVLMSALAMVSSAGLAGSDPAVSASPLVLVPPTPMPPPPPSPPESCGGGTCALIGDQAWLDADRDGMQDFGDPDNPEIPLPGVTVTLYRNQGTGTGFVPWQTTTTNANGLYQFDVALGQYKLHFAYSSTNLTYGVPLSLTAANTTGQDDFSDSDPDPLTGFTDVFTINPSSYDFHNVRWDAGFSPDLGNGGNCAHPAEHLTLGDKVWNDINNDGVQDEGEAGIPGVTVELWRWLTLHPWVSVRMNMGREDITDASGEYLFECIEQAGNYFVVLRNADFYRPSTVTNSNPDDDVVNDNNCYLDPYHEREGAIGNSYGISLNHGSEPSGTPANENRTLDCGMSCFNRKLDVIFVFDASRSMASAMPGANPTTRIVAARDAANRLVDEMNLGPHRAAVVKYSRNATTVRHLTSIESEIESGIAAVTASGSTRIHAGIDEAMAEFERNHDPDALSVIILLSDGEPNDGWRDDALDSASRARSHWLLPRIISIGLGTKIDIDLLINMATDGEYHAAPSAEELVAIYEDLAPHLCEPSGGGGGLECGPDQSTYDINVSTGWSAGPLPIGSPDDEWTIPSIAEGHQAVVVPKWTTWKLLDASQWVSYISDGWSVPQPTTYRYAFGFDLLSQPSDVELRFSAYADNRIERALLNEHELDNSSGGEFNWLPISPVSRDPSKLNYGTGEAGENTLTIDVFDYGVKTGLDVEGRLRVCTDTGTLPDPSIVPGCPTGDVNSWQTTVTMEYKGQDYVCVWSPVASFRKGQYIPFAEVEAQGLKYYNGGKRNAAGDPDETCNRNVPIIRGSNCGASNVISHCGESLIDNAGAYTSTFYTLGWLSLGNGVFSLLGDTTPQGVPVRERQWGDVSYGKTGPAVGYVIERYMPWTIVEDPDKRKSGDSMYAIVSPDYGRAFWATFRQDDSIHDCGEGDCPILGPFGPLLDVCP